MQRLIAITGANGLLGKALVSILKKDNEILPFSHQQLDISKWSDIKNNLDNLKFDVLINCAAYTDVDGCEDNRELAFLTNAKGAENLSIFCSKRKIKLIHISTDYIFDGNKKIPYKENDEPNPLSTYAKSKYQGEQAILKISEDYIILRVSWLFGPFKNNFVSWVVEKLKKNEKIYVVKDQIGAPTYTLDLSKAIIKLIEIGFKGIIHFRNEEECSREEQARYIAKLINLKEELLIPAEKESVYKKAKRPSYSVLDISLYKNLIKEEVRNWKEAIKDYILNYYSRGNE